MAARREAGYYEEKVQRRIKPFNNSDEEVIAYCNLNNKTQKCEDWAQFRTNAGWSINSTIYDDKLHGIAIASSASEVQVYENILGVTTGKYTIYYSSGNRYNRVYNDTNHLIAYKKVDAADTYF